MDVIYKEDEALLKAGRSILEKLDAQIQELEAELARVKNGEIWKENVSLHNELKVARAERATCDLIIDDRNERIQTLTRALEKAEAALGAG